MLYRKQSFYLLFPYFRNNLTKYQRKRELSSFSKSHLFCSVQFSSVAQLSPALCDPMNRSTPGLPVHHQLMEFTQTHVHRVGDAIQPSHHLSSPSPPAPNPSQHHGLFQWVNSSHQAAKVLKFQLKHMFHYIIQNWFWSCGQNRIQSTSNFHFNSVSLFCLRCFIWRMWGLQTIVYYDNPLQYSCREDPLDGRAPVHGVLKSRTPEHLHFHFSLPCIGEGNGNPLQCSCLENPRDRGTSCAAVCGVSQSRTQWKWLSAAAASTIHNKIAGRMLNYLGIFSRVHFDHVRYILWGRQKGYL